MQGWFRLGTFDRVPSDLVIPIFLGITGSDTTVCIIDDGLDYNHQEL